MAGGEGGCCLLLRFGSYGIFHRRYRATWATWHTTFIDFPSCFLLISFSYFSSPPCLSFLPLTHHPLKESTPLFVVQKELERARWFWLSWHVRQSSTSSKIGKATKQKGERTSFFHENAVSHTRQEMALLPRPPQDKLMRFPVLSSSSFFFWNDSIS